MTPRSVIVEAATAIRVFYRGAKNQPGLVARLCRPLFDALSVENRLWLARDVTLGMTSASVIAKDRFGEMGTTRVDGNEVRVGVMVGEGDGAVFEVRGRGPTWSEAFADAARREEIGR